MAVVKFVVERSLLEVALAPWLVGTIEHISTPPWREPSCQASHRHHGASSTRCRCRAGHRTAAALGYVYYPYKSEVMHWFCKPSPARSHASPAFGTARKRPVASRLAFREVHCVGTSRSPRSTRTRRNLCPRVFVSTARPTEGESAIHRASARRNSVVPAACNLIVSSSRPPRLLFSRASAAAKAFRNDPR